LMNLESVDERSASSMSRLFESNPGRLRGYANSSLEALVDEDADDEDEDEDEDLDNEGANSMQNQIDPLEDEEAMVDPPDEDDDDDLEDGELDEEEDEEPISR